MTIFETKIVEAETKEEALELYDSGDLEGWEEEDVGCAQDLGLLCIYERDADGEFTIAHDVKEGEFV